MPHDIHGWLNHHGFTTDTSREDTEGYRRKPFESEAICYSQECGAYGRIKEVLKTTVFCPDCDHALCWERKRKRK